MKTVLAGTLLSLSALVVAALTFTREAREAAPEPQPGNVRAEHGSGPEVTSRTTTHRAPVDRTRPPGTPRLSQFSGTDPQSPANPARPQKRPSGSSIVLPTEDPEPSRHLHKPREQREDISFATSHKKRIQAAPSPLPLRGNPDPAVLPPATTAVTVDTDLSPSQLPTDLSSSPLLEADEDFRYRQIHGQQAWMARHIRMHNGIPEEQPEH